MRILLSATRGWSMIHPAAVLTAAGVHREAAARPPANVVVRRGDSLSGIAARYRIEWPGLYEANRAVIGGEPQPDSRRGAPAHALGRISGASGCVLQVACSRDGARL